MGSIGNSRIMFSVLVPAGALANTNNDEDGQALGPLQSVVLPLFPSRALLK